jgi:hypothetical protein
MKIKPMNKFLKWIIPERFTAITLCPFGIYYRKKMSAATLRHETIHWKQQIEMLVIFFYLWYVIEWIVKLMIYWKKAYMFISFEIEAYNWTPQNRKRYGWIKYII